MSTEIEASANEYLYGKLLENEEIDAFLNALTALAVHELFGDGDEVLCGVTLFRHKRAAAAASSSDEAQELNEIQYDYRDGPCLSASRHQVTVEVPDFMQDDRWPDYSRAVTQRGIRSVLAVPFLLEHGDGAALNLYSTVPAHFTPEHVERAQDYAQQASQALALAVRLARHKDAETDVLEAMKSRTTIDLAMGIIMGQNGCNQEEAFIRLQSDSSSRNIKLRDVAVGVVGAADTEPATTHFDR